MRFLERLLSVLAAVWRRRTETNPTPVISATVTTERTGYVRPDILQFIERIRPAALRLENMTAIPWRFAMVQAAHESNFGKSLLTKEANNLFGITGDSWDKQGKPVWWSETRECAKDGTPFVVRRPFRKYASWEESLADWAALIQNRYPAAFAAAQSGYFEGFARGLEAGGYATDRDKATGKLVYADKLIALRRSLEGVA